MTEKLFDLVREVAHSECMQYAERCMRSVSCLHVTMSCLPAKPERERATGRHAMTILSKLRQSSQPALTRFSKTYANHRPLIQRILTAGFIIHVLAGTFRSLSTRPTPPSTSKGKDRDRSKASVSEKPPRVAVRLHHTFIGLSLLSSLLRSTPCFIRD